MDKKKLFCFLKWKCGTLPKRHYLLCLFTLRYHQTCMIHMTSVIIPDLYLNLRSICLHFFFVGKPMFDFHFLITFFCSTSFILQNKVEVLLQSEMPCLFSLNMKIILNVIIFHERDTKL